MQDVEKEIAAARAQGLDDTDDYIQELQSKWQGYAESVKEIQEDAKESAKNAVAELVDYRIDMIKSNGKLQRRIQEKDSAYALGRRTDNKKSVRGVPCFRERDRVLAEKVSRRMLKESCCKGRIRPYERKSQTPQGA